MKTKEKMAIDLVGSGDRLAEALIDGSGRVLIPAGAELTDSLLDALRRRGVLELLVERLVEVDQTAREAMQARVEQRLSQLFRLAGEGMETRLLFQAVRDFRLEHEA